MPSVKPPEFRPDVDYVVSDRGFGTPCWIWIRGRNMAGYGTSRQERVVSRAHRAVWEAERGPIADGLHLHHRCGVKLCVNPEHAEPITSVDHGKITAASRLGYRPPTLGKNLRALRKAAGLSQSELGHRVGTEGNVISRWERGAVVPSAYYLQALAHELGVSMEDLLKEAKAA